MITKTITEPGAPNTPLHFKQPDDWDGYNRSVTDRREDVRFLGNSHIRIWYNNQMEGYQPHSHGAIEILSCVEGGYTVTSNQQVYNLNQGDILLIPPHQPHRLLGGVKGARFITLFDPTPFAELTDFKVIMARFTQPVRVSAEQSPALHQVMANCLAKASEIYFAQDSMWELGVYAQILNMYTYVGKNYFNNNESFTTEDGRHNHKRYDKFAHLLKYLEDNLDSDMSLEQAAEYIGYSKFHFSRLFKEYTGITYYDHIQNIRIRAAQELLATDTSITEIAYRTGFHNLTTFSRSFKKATGLTPTEYRSITVNP